MPYPIDKKFVITVTTSALFDMKESDDVFQTYGVKEYKKYQESHIDDTLAKGLLFLLFGGF